MILCIAWVWNHQTMYVHAQALGYIWDTDIWLDREMLKNQQDRSHRGDLIIYVMLQHVVTAFRWGFSSQVFWSLISLLSVICVWNTSASTQHTQITHAAFAGLLWWSHILSEGEVKMSGPWELVTVSRWLNDRVVHCNCHSIITILHKQGQLRTDKKRQKQEHWRLGSLTTNYLSSILTLHRFLSLDPGRNSTS